MADAYDEVRAADAALALPDPQAAVTAINALSDPVAVDVATADIRAVLWPKLEYARMALVSRRDEPFADATAEGLVLTAITAISLLDSGRTIYASDDAAWAATVGGLLLFTSVQPQIVSNATYLAVSAMRTVQVPRWRRWGLSAPLSVDDLVSIRGAGA